MDRVVQRGPARHRDASSRAGWTAHLVRASEQALDDLARSGASEVVLVRHDRGADARAYLDDLETAAARAAFVAARLRMGSDTAFDALEATVRAVLENVRVPSFARPRPGLVRLLDAFALVHGASAEAELARRFDARNLAGELADLARDYVAAKGTARAEAKRIDAWMRGPDAGASTDNKMAAGLSARSAKRALSELSRLVLALGHRGMLLLVDDADALARLSPGRRDASYTVLRELVDNADGGRGLVSTQIVLVASRTLAAGPRSLQALRPLAMRMNAPMEAFAAAPSPHRTLIELAPPAGPNGDWAAPLPPLRPSPEGNEPMLRALVRVAHGLPPIEATSAMSVGAQRIDGAIDALFEHTEALGSVFTLVTGEYGSGKTHFLLHLVARALGDRRPVFRLSLEQLDHDLGHPERHLRRMLEHATLPGEGAPNLLDRLAGWTRSPAALGKLVRALEAIASASEEAAEAAARALAALEQAKGAGSALEAYLGALDLAVRAPSPSARRDAYARLLLWLDLLGRLEDLRGPVLLIDEVENLYRGMSAPERRTALRSLSFYCGGALPRACVALAVTPEALGHLRAEAPALLEEVADQKTLLPWEDASMFCRRLLRAKPLSVPALASAQRIELAERVRATHASVRGPVPDPAWDAFARALAADGSTPRELVKRAVDRLESLWWTATPAR